MRISSVSLNYSVNRYNSPTNSKNISQKGIKGTAIGSIIPAGIIAGTLYLFGGENYTNAIYPATITSGIFGGAFGHFYERYLKEDEKTQVNQNKSKK